MKGILLAGGKGSRLHPLTLAVSKQLLPIYDKPMIYYPLSTLMLAGVRDILLISTPRDLGQFQLLLGDGSAFGVQLSYAEQPAPNGVAEAFIIARDFLAGEGAAMILGDNLYHGEGLAELCREAAARPSGASIFACEVDDPQRYGVVELDEASGQALSIEEKPARPRSNWAVTGLYFYDSDVSDIAATLCPSPRGELEISDVNNIYLERGELHVHKLGREDTWLDMGTYDSLHEASCFVREMVRREGGMLGCPEEVAFKHGWLDTDALLERAARLGETRYGDYLRRRAMDRAA